MVLTVLRRAAASVRRGMLLTEPLAGQRGCIAIAGLVTVPVVNEDTGVVVEVMTRDEVGARLTL